MSAETLQTLTQIAIGFGIVVTALGGFGSYYYGKNAEDARAQELRTSVDELLTHSQTLERKLEPFQEIAQEAHPDLDQDAALESLRNDLEELQKIARKHEFTPLSSSLRATFAQRLQRIAPGFSSAGMSVKVTHETWASPTTKQYASQLVELLTEAEIQAHGPEQITYFLVTPASPLEWGYNEADIQQVQPLYETLLTIIRPNPKWTKASHQKRGTVRIHFGGQVIFEPDGMVEVQ